MKNVNDDAAEAAGSQARTALVEQLRSYLPSCECGRVQIELDAAADEIERLQAIAAAAAEVNATTFSHVNGRDLLAELHPRKTIDIKVRKDGVDRWHEGDWLTNTYKAMEKLRAALANRTERSEAKPAEGGTQS